MIVQLDIVRSEMDSHYERLYFVEFTPDSGFHDQTSDQPAPDHLSLLKLYYHWGNESLAGDGNGSAGGYGTGRL
jgi:hypothetical protein